MRCRKGKYAPQSQNKGHITHKIYLNLPKIQIKGILVRYFFKLEISMLKKIGLTLLCVAASLSTPTFAMVEHTLQPAMTLEYDLPPNQPQVFVNYMIWEINANCTISGVDSTNQLFAEALSKSGKINDITLTKGSTMTVEVHPGDNLKLTAQGGAKVQITNLGEHTVKATCVA